MERKIELLQRMLDESRYTVALCGSEMTEEGGYYSFKIQSRAYEIEEEYGASPEELYSSRYFNTRPEKFYEFYKKEILEAMPQMTVSGEVLARMDAAGKLGCVISENLFDLSLRSGCRNVCGIRGSVFQNYCLWCKKEYPMDHIKNAQGIPRCETCGGMIRPRVFLYGEQVDSQLVTRATMEVEKAEVLLVLGTYLNSEVFYPYIRSFQGKYLVMIHETRQYDDYKADLLIVDKPKNVLTKLHF